MIPMPPNQAHENAKTGSIINMLASVLAALALAHHDPSCHLQTHPSSP